MRKGNKVLANDIIRFVSVIFLVDRKRNRPIALKIATNRSEDAKYLAGQASKTDCLFTDTPNECLEQLHLTKLLEPDELGEKNWEFMTEDEIDAVCANSPVILENGVEDEDGNHWCMANEEAGKGGDEAF